jgi:heme-degrading monooxygenase HmoA
MEFDPSKTDDFEEIFYGSQPKIEQFDGCHKVELYKDSKLPNVYYTHSLWDDEDALDKYRHSDFFAGTWSKTKKLFSGKPMAFSLLKA